jgi:hypothetical protein
LLFVPLFGAPKRNTSKICKRDVTLALDGHLLIGQHNNQPKVGLRGRRDIWEGARPGRNMWGGCHTIIWGGKLSNKKTKLKNCGLKWLPINISNETTNQKQTGVTEEKKTKRFNRGGSMGEVWFHCFGGKRVWRDVE